MLQLAAELGNVSKACQIMGYHRDSFYEIKRAFQMGGTAALIEQRRGPRGPHPNRVPQEVEDKILDYALVHPTHGCQRVANELRMQNIQVSPSGVRGVWSRHDISSRPYPRPPRAASRRSPCEPLTPRRWAFAAAGTTFLFRIVARGSTSASVRFS